MAHLLVRFLIEVGFAGLWIGIPTAKVTGPVQHLRLGEPRALRERVAAEPTLFFSRSFSRTPSGASTAPEEEDLSSHGGNEDAALLRVAAAWAALAREADDAQERGFFPTQLGLSADDRVQLRATANAQWARHGPRLFMLEEHLRRALVPRALGPISGLPLFMDPNVAFFMSALRRQTPQLRHLYRFRRSSSSHRAMRRGSTYGD